MTDPGALLKSRPYPGPHGRQRRSTSVTLQPGALTETYGGPGGPGGRIAVALLLVMLSFGAAAAGPYDGPWLGEETASGGGQTFTGSTGTLLYQSAADTLHMLVASDQRQLTLKGANTLWALPSPTTVTIDGIRVRFETFELRFHGLNRFTGTYQATAQGIIINGVFDQDRLPCTNISSSFSSNSLSGGPDTLHCFKLDVPANALQLRATTSGGTGDADLLVVYHKPDFQFRSSEGSNNNESVTINSPRAGIWYVGIGSGGVAGFNGVRLNVTVEVPNTPDPPTPRFSASPRSGDRPLTVSFSDTSSGSIDEWLWEFGDGATSTQRNPTHTYRMPGSYNVRLRVTGPGGTRSLTKPALIEVTAPGATVPFLEYLLQGSE